MIKDALDYLETKGYTIEQNREDYVVIDNDYLYFNPSGYVSGDLRDALGPKGHVELLQALYRGPREKLQATLAALPGAYVNNKGSLRINNTMVFYATEEGMEVMRYADMVVELGPGVLRAYADFIEEIENEIS